MASKFSISATRSDPPNDLTMTNLQETSHMPEDILSVIDSWKNQAAQRRCISIEDRIEENRQKLLGTTNRLYRSSEERRNSKTNNSDKSIDLLTKRQTDAISMHNGVGVNNRDRENDRSHEEVNASSPVLLGSSIAVKNPIRPIKLAEVNKLPPYTTWIFLDRNQRMTEDQSVLGRRRIYYDQSGGEALICSDSEEEVIDDEEEKKDFADSEDYILRMTIKEVGSSDAVLESLAQCLSKKPCEIRARHELLTKGQKDVEDVSQIGNSFLNKDLDAALDSFDNLFCRRCLVFDCGLHGCSQDLVYPPEKQLPYSPLDDENATCSLQCYRLDPKSEIFAMVSSPRVDYAENRAPSTDAHKQISSMKKSAPVTRGEKAVQSESASSNARNISESSDSEIGPMQDTTCVDLSTTPSKIKLAGKYGIHKRNSKRVAECVIVSMRKRQKNTSSSDNDSAVSGSLCSSDTKLRSIIPKENEDASSSSRKKTQSPVFDSPSKINLPGSSYDDAMRKEEFVGENICKEEPSTDKSWKTLEKGLFEKGVEIFGRNSCLIARNLLTGMKTCSEVFHYMKCVENKLSCGAGDGVNSLIEGHSKGDFNETAGNGIRRRSRFLRRRGKVRRLKYSWKSAAYHSIRKRISEKKDQPCRQYNPCNCQSACGKQCPCHINETCCEKYCGCFKTCKNRFRGCHCAKSQCRSKKCPCFAADRECDPDVCRNCWVGCGDGSLGVPSQRGDNYECRNMKLLLKQQQRVLLGRSDVSGWGAFLKNSVGKHEYLGEYTGELISHREADKRGKIYDRENSSFLFNLNDQFVLDAFRKGDKLKFANHSPNPNCYAKVIMVGGDHRVGIFAKERIGGGEELFYDYRYEPDRAPAWARKPDAPGSKKDDNAPSSGRAKKLA